ncbi:MAG: tetratricopeptide repeat protein [Roseivirga sp.]|nr:tetratricopeptide repeat protein [Roseivirga sp.]
MDSLKVMARETTDERKPRHYLRLGQRYMGREQYDSARKYLSLMAEYAEQNGQLGLMGQAYANLGGVSNELGDYISGIENYERAIEYLLQANEEINVAGVRTNLGQAYKGMNIYTKAFENLFQAADTYERKGEKKRLAAVYSTIGNIHREIGTMDISYEYLIKALELREELDYKSGVARSLQNLGNWHLESKDLPKARELYRQSLDIKRAHMDTSSFASSFAKLGEVAVESQNYEKARGYFEESLRIRTRSKNKAGTVTSSNHLARLHLSLNDPTSALPYLRLALKNAVEGHLLKEQATARALFREYYVQMGDYQSALKSSNQLIEVNELILDKEKTNSLIEAEVRFNIKSKDRELAFKENELESLEKERGYFIMIILVLTALAIMVVIFLRESRKLSRLRKLAKERVERLLNELNHRTKNHLQAQSGLIRQQMLKLKDQSTKEVIRDIDNQIKSINLIHQSLYASTEDSPECIDLTTYLKNIVENLMISFRMTGNQVKIKLDLDHVDIDLHKAMPIGLILNESVTNVIKHAFKGLKTRELTVRLKKKEPDLLRLTVADNGPGFSSSIDKEGHSGLRIMRDLAEELSGYLTFGNGQGAMIQVCFPVRN